MRTLNDYLKEKGITGYRLAQLTVLPQSTITDLVSGKTDIYNAKWSTVMTICNALDITAGQLHLYLQSKETTD